MKRFVLCSVILFCVSGVGLVARGTVQPPTLVELETGGSVTGSGSTYQAAYNDARNRLPAGKAAKAVRTWESGKTWYCRMDY